MDMTLAEFQQLQVGCILEYGTLIPGILPEVKAIWEVIEINPTEQTATFVVSYMGVIIDTKKAVVTDGNVQFVGGP